METKAQVWRKRAFNPSHFMGSVLTGVVCGAAGGIAAGIGARLAMRVIALVAGMTPVFTPGGSVFIVGLGAVLGMWLGILFAFLLPALPGGSIKKGLFFGLVPGLILALLILLIEQEGELALAPKWMVALMFAALPLIYGLVAGLVTAWLIPTPADSSAKSQPFVRTTGTLTMVLAAVSLGCEAVVALRQMSILNLPHGTMIAISQAGGASLILAILFGAAGLLRSEAAGKNRLGKVGLGITLALPGLLGLVAISAGLDLMHVHGLIRLSAEIMASSDPLPIVILLVPGLAGPLMAGIAILRSGRWSGWRAYLMLFIGIIPPVSLVLLNPRLPLISGGEVVPNRTITAYLLGVLYALCWLLVGNSLRTGLRQDEPDE